jgi:hypothetical protein
VYFGGFLIISHLLLSMFIRLVILVSSFTAVLQVILAVRCASGLLSGSELGSYSLYPISFVNLPQLFPSQRQSDSK